MSIDAMILEHKTLGERHKALGAKIEEAVRAHLSTGAVETLKKTPVFTADVFPPKQTGKDKKLDLVAIYGEGATFTAGGPLPAYANGAA